LATQNPSRASLQDVLAAIDLEQGLPPKRRQDLRSAVRLVAKVMEREPQLIAADPRGLGRRLEGISPLSLGLSAGRWANTRSLLRAALKLVVPVMPGASTTPLLPQWEPLAAEARKVGSCWLRLGRLLRWLSERQIGPETVTLADLERFKSAYLVDALLGHPEQSWQAARQSWERMREACPDWPQIALEKAPNGRVYSLPWEAFPASLKVEIDALLERLAGRDLSVDGPTRPLKPATLKARDHELRVHASALVHQGLAPESLTSLATCLAIENYRLGLQWLYARYGSKPSRTMHNMAANLKAIARHWLKADVATLDAMAKIVRRLAPPDQAMSAKNRDRLRPFDSAENIKALVNLPQTIRRHIETAKSARSRKIGLSTTAMAIEILLVAPLRLGNLSALHLDHNFLRVGQKIHLFVPKEEVKNNVDLEFELPPETVEMLEWYTSCHRKADAANRYLFAGKGLAPKDENTLRLQIMETVRAFTGLTINPHLFRHIAASIYLQANPSAYEVVRQLLGHRRLATTSAFYTGQEERRARQHFVDTIRKLRDGAEAGLRERRSRP
jgi:integrase